MSTANERRKNPRVSCQEVWLQIKVGDPAGPASSQQLPVRQVKVINLSDSGISLIAAEPFELGQVVFFLDPNLPSQGTVVWTCQSKVECKAGIHFLR